MSSKKLLLGSTLSTIHLLLQIIIAFFLTPLMIKTLGDKNYGIWILLSTIVGYYGLLDFGISGAVQRFVSRAIGAGKHEDKKYISSTAFYLFFLVGIIILLISVIIVFNADHLLKDPDDLVIIKSVLLVLGVGVGLTFPFRIFVGILNANLRFDISRYIEIGTVIVRTVFVVYVLKTGGSLYLLSIVTVSATVIEYVLMFIFALKIDPYISVSPRYFTIKRLKSIIDFSAATFVGQLAKIVSERSGPIIIAKIISASAVTSFAVAFNFINYFMQMIWSVIGVIGPVLSQEDGRRDHDAIAKTFLFTVNLCFYISYYCGVMSIIYGDKFITRWLGPQYNEVYEFLVIFMIAMTANLCTAPIYYLLNNISKHRQLAAIQLIESVIIVILSIILCKQTGNSGAVYGYAIPLFFFSIFIRHVIACLSIDISITKFYLIIIKKMVIATILIFPIWFIIRNIVEANYYSIIGAICIHSIIYLVGFYIFGLTKVEKKSIVKIMPFLRFTEKLKFIKEKGQ